MKPRAPLATSSSLLIQLLRLRFCQFYRGELTGETHEEVAAKTCDRTLLGHPNKELQQLGGGSNAGGLAAGQQRERNEHVTHLHTIPAA